MDQSRIFDAWGDEEWWDKGTAVRVSLVAFGHASQDARLDGQVVETIYSDLTGKKAGGVDLDLTKAKVLPVNRGLCFQGLKLGGPFEIPGAVAG